MAKDFNIFFLNCEGIKRSKEYVNYFLNVYFCDILCLQETWMLDNTLDFMNSIHKDYLHVSIAGKDTTTELLRGRPAGGVLIVYKKSISESIVGIKSTNRRVCGVKITSNGNFSCLLLNVYLPCDNYSNTTVTQGFVDCVEYIENLYNLSDCSSYICCCDFDTSFERNNAQSCYLTDFIESNSLCISWDHVSALKDYSYVNHSLQHKSCIDHFIVTKNIFDSIIGNMVLFETTTPSNHNDIQLTITCFDNAIYSQSNRLQSDRNPKIAWHKATLSFNYKAYKSNLDQQLIAIEQTLDLYCCFDYNCKCIDHRIAIGGLCIFLSECCLKASIITIPQTTYGMTKESPGWNDLAYQERKQSLFWYWIWCEFGKP